MKRRLTGQDCYFNGKDGHSQAWADYPGVGRVYDRDISDFVMKHTTLFDKLFRPWKIAEATLISENMLFKVLDTPEGDWVF